MKRILFLACIIAAKNSFAQNDTTAVPDSFHLLTPVEVRATRVSEKTPFAVSNITPREIKKQNLGQNFPYLISQAPSVVTSSDDGVGVGYASFRIRGTDITRINVTFNGVPTNDPESQGTFFVNFGDLASSTNSVQIQRGVGSSTNGPGAFGASINIFNAGQSKEATASISNSYGSFNTWKHTVQAATGMLKGGFQFDVRLSKLNSDGYIRRSFSDLKSLHFISGWTSKNEMTNIKFNLLTGKERTGQAWNGIGTSYTNKETPVDYQEQLDKIGRRTNTLGLMADGKTYYDDQTDNYQQDYYQLFINQKFNSYWSANLTGYYTRGRGFYNEYKAEESFSTYGQPNVIIGGETIETTNLTRQLWLDNHYYGSVFSTNYNKANTDLIFGGAVTNYDAKHYGFVKWADLGFAPDHRWYNNTAEKNDFNIFGKLQQQFIEGLYGFVDLQYRNVVYNIFGFRKNPEIKSQNEYGFFNPKAGLSYIIRHPYSAQSKVYGSFAVANKEPNRDDFEASPDQSPKPEHLNDIEAGYQYNSSMFAAGINGYYMKYKDQLILTGKINDVGSYARTNVDDSYRAGVELTASVKPVNWFLLDANATFSKSKIKSITQYSDDYDAGGQIEETFTNTDIAFSPNLVAGATATFEPFSGIWDNQNFYIDLVKKYVGRQYLDNSSNKLRSIHPYGLTDLRLRYNISTNWIKELGLILLMNNVFNKKYENNGYTYSYKYDGTITTESYYYPQAGTNFNFGVNLTF